MRKGIIWIFTLFVGMVLLPVLASAEQAPSLQVQSSSGVIGGQAVVRITIQNPNNLKTLNVKLKYDSTKLSLGQADVIKGDGFSSSWMYVSHVEQEAGRVNLVAISTEGFQNNAEKQVATLNFTIKQGVQAGTTAITVEQLNGYYDVSVPASLQYTEGAVSLFVSSNSNSDQNGQGSSETPPLNYPDNYSLIGMKLTQQAIVTNGIASVGFTRDAVKKLIEELGKTVSAGNRKAKQQLLEIKAEVKPDEVVTKTKVTLEKSALSDVVSMENTGIGLTTPLGRIVFDSKAVQVIAGQSNGDISITVEQQKVEDVWSSISSEKQEAIREKLADRPIYNFIVSSQSGEISRFQGGKADITLPYNLKLSERPDAIVVYFIGPDGKLQSVRGRYDAETKSVQMTLTHFSSYAIGYQAVNFKDVADSDWYADAVSFLAARNIITGVGGGQFAPELAVTRAQFIKMLLDAYGIEPIRSDDNFADAGDTWYTGYLAAAKQLSITSGTGENKFAPDQTVTRQEMLTLIYNALRLMDELPVVEEEVLSQFADQSEVAAWANEAVTYLVKNGIISGYDGQIHPTQTATRAQTAQLIYNLLSY
ncbi:S-layer homology domain-containing protein [Paenibacillus ferrarius]|uniref:S-layer homology domain-containing protein n=1 Tax=Paenibacillus ferrarius TaxID=1469647 RepID=UPI003D289280